MEDRRPHPGVVRGWLLKERADYWDESDALEFSASRMEEDGVDNVNEEDIKQLWNDLDDQDEVNLNNVEEERIEIAHSLGINIYEVSEFADAGLGSTADYLLGDGKRSIDDISLEANQSGLSDSDLRMVLEGFYDEWLEVDEIARKIGLEGDYRENPSAQTIKRRLAKAGVETPSDDELEMRRDPEKKYVDQIFHKAKNKFMYGWKSAPEIEEELGLQEREVSVAEVLQSRGIDAKEDPSKIGRDEPGPQERFRESSPQGLATDYEVTEEVEDRHLMALMIDEGINSKQGITAVYNEFHDPEDPATYREVERKIKEVDEIKKRKTQDGTVYELESDVNSILEPHVKASIYSVHGES